MMVTYVIWHSFSVVLRTTRFGPHSKFRSKCLKFKVSVYHWLVFSFHYSKCQTPVPFLEHDLVIEFDKAPLKGKATLILYSTNIFKIIVLSLFSSMAFICFSPPYLDIVLSVLWYMLLALAFECKTYISARTCLHLQPILSDHYASNIPGNLQGPSILSLFFQIVIAIDIDIKSSTFINIVFLHRNTSFFTINIHQHTFMLLHIAVVLLYW